VIFISGVATTGVQPALQVEDARRAFGSRPSLAGVSLSLRRGEIYALLGPNGAGKTTLVRSIYGRVRLDSGRITMGGRDPRHERKARRRLGLVPQELALYPDLTPGENLAVFGRLAGLRRGEVRAAVETALDWTGLAGRAASLTGELSGGQQRRLNLAAGTLHQPDVLLLDEPTVGIDPEAREGIHELLRGLRARGMAILLTTHDLDQAASLADRIGILVDGQMVAEGTLAALVEQAFGSGRELLVTLAAEPGPEARALLRSEGLSAAAGTRDFSGPLAGGLPALSALGRRLAEAGLAVAEIRLREAGLRGVFFRVAGREIAP
jgi:ABC-2 type transport system ATP-binding protein